MTHIAELAKNASLVLEDLNSSAKNSILKEIADSLLKNSSYIIKKNLIDLRNAKKRNLSSSLIDRLTLNKIRIKGMADSVAKIASLDDPVGEIISMKRRPNGILVGKMRVPIGVIAIIYESRPNVTSDCAALCLKSGNAVILRGGSESAQSNAAIHSIITDVLKKKNVHENAVSFIKSTSHDAVKELLGLDKLIDLVIPRGGENLIKEIMKYSKIPVIKHYKGVCHTYVDGEADLNMAENISYNAKVQRPGVCNAMETLLVHKDVAARFLPSMAHKFKKANVELRGDENSRRILKGIKKAADDDWYTEYLDLILSVKVVDSVDEAISHINKYGTKHSDCIVTENYENAMKFLKKVDSACVYVNASTRFTDGGEFGMGAEIGISTDKLHARGPMGLEELTTYKYIIFGQGQIRE